MAKKIAVVIHKGGVGKTTTATNLAAAIAMRGQRALLVDLDEQANATKGLGFDPATLPGSLYHLFTDASRDLQTSIFETAVPNLHLLPGHPNLSQTEKGMTLQAADPNPDAPDARRLLAGLLAPLDSLYDFIIFDTPPSLNYMTINALAASDELVIPAAASAYTADGLARTWRAYERARSDYNPSLRPPRILVTRVKRTKAAEEVFNDVSKTYLDAVLPQLIVETTKVDEAAQVHQPVVLYDPEGAAAQGYKRVAEILIDGQ